MKLVLASATDWGLDPGPSADAPHETKAALLPKTLREAASKLSQPSLRGTKRQSNPDYFRGRILDCFASLAMTVKMLAHVRLGRIKK
jgi:hypothetical protein